MGYGGLVLLSKLGADIEISRVAYIVVSGWLCTWVIIVVMVSDIEMSRL
jgi:hypothetical protein